MKRKVTLHGPATLSVSLPLQWAREHNVKKGDEVDVQVEKGGLYVRAGEIASKKEEITVTIPEMDGRPLLFLIRNLYINGYDTIHLHFEQKIIKHYRKKLEMTPRALILYELKRLTGLEITSMKGDKCTLTCIAKESTEELEKSMQRTFFIMKEMFETLHEAVINGSKDLYNYGNDMHDQATTFIAYNLRTLNKIGYKNRLTTIKLSQFIYLLDTILDLTKYFLRELAAYVPYKNKKIHQLSKAITDIFSLTQNTYHKFTLERIDEISKKINEIRDVSIDLSNNWNKRESRFLHHTESILEEIFKLNVIRMGMEF